MLFRKRKVDDSRYISLNVLFTALHHSKFQERKVAKMLEISRKRVQELIEEYGIVGYVKLHQKGKT